MKTAVDVAKKAGEGSGARTSILDDIFHAHGELVRQSLDESGVAGAVSRFETGEVALRYAGSRRKITLAQAALLAPPGELARRSEYLLDLLMAEGLSVSGACARDLLRDILGFAIGDEAPILVERQDGELFPFGGGDDISFVSPCFGAGHDASPLFVNRATRTDLDDNNFGFVFDEDHAVGANAEPRTFDAGERLDIAGARLGIGFNLGSDPLLLPSVAAEVVNASSV
jgi:hypothetical protein